MFTQVCATSRVITKTAVPERSEGGPTAQRHQGALSCDSASQTNPQTVPATGTKFYRLRQ